MIYFKITNNQDIIDVNTDLGLKFVKYVDRCRSFMICNPTDNPMGIIASDSSEVYGLVDIDDIPNITEIDEMPENIGDYKQVRVIEITEEEYLVFKKALDEQKEIIDPDPYIPPEPEPTPEEKEKEEEYRRSLQFVKDSKIEYMSYLCNQIIENGITIVLSDNLEHQFLLKDEDQRFLLGELMELNMGASQISYHDHNGNCTYYSAEDMTKIIQAAFFHIKFHQTYFGSLRYYINSMDSLVDVSDVYYGMKIPEEYQSEPLKDLLAQMEQTQEQNNEENNS